MMESINFGDKKNKNKKKKLWAINCELEQKREIEALEKKESNFINMVKQKIKDQSK